MPNRLNMSAAPAPSLLSEQAASVSSQLLFYHVPEASMAIELVDSHINNHLHRCANVGFNLSSKTKTHEGRIFNYSGFNNLNWL